MWERRSKKVRGRKKPQWRYHRHTTKLRVKYYIPVNSPIDFIPSLHLQHSNKKDSGSQSMHYWTRDGYFAPSPNHCLQRLCCKWRGALHCSLHLITNLWGKHAYLTLSHVSCSKCVNGVLIFLNCLDVFILDLILFTDSAFTFSNCSVYITCWLEVPS